MVIFTPSYRAVASHFDRVTRQAAMLMPCCIATQLSLLILPLLPFEDVVLAYNCLYTLYTHCVSKAIRVSLPVCHTEIPVFVQIM